MNTEIDHKIAVILVAEIVGYSKHMERDEKVAKYYFSKAKANKYSKNILAQAIYNKGTRDDAITTFNFFKY